jgi:hypothetical protein
MALSTNKDVVALIKKATKQGWQIDPTKSGHLRWTSPDGRFFHSASSPSDFRAIKYIRQYLRKYGMKM